MKYVNTLYRTDEKINLDQLHNLICYAIDEEQFVILTDLESCSFMQMAILQQQCIIEYRLYHSTNDYQHYRLFVDEPEQAYGYFEQFYRDISINLQHWHDVTQEMITYEQS